MHEPILIKFGTQLQITTSMIVTGASLTETKMWAAVRENGDFSRSWIMSKRINMFEFFFTIG